MKRILVLMLALLALLAPAALGEGRLIDLGEEEYVNRLFSDGDTLYILGDERLYTWRPGQEAPDAWESEIEAAPEAEQEPDAPRQGIGFDELNLYTDGDGLHALARQWDEDGDFDKLLRLDLVFTDRGTVEAGGIQALDLPDDLRNEEYWGVSGVCAQDGALVLLWDGENGMSLTVMDPENPRRAETTALKGWSSQLLPSAVGAILTEYDFDGEGAQVLSRVLADGSLEELCRLPVSAEGLAADPVTGAVYAAVDGKARPVDLETGELGAPFGGLPMRPSQAAALGGCYAVNLNSRIAVLDTSALLDEDKVLGVYGPFYDDWMNSAMLDYTVQHPEVTPVRSGDYLTSEQILERMLTQSPEPDIYLTYTRDAAYEALLERGYMLPLSDSAALTALAGRLYPGVARTVARNGELMAVPLREDSYGMGISTRLLERLGLSLEDVPGDWMGFLDFLEERVKPALAELGEGRFTYDGLTARAFKEFLISKILNDFVYASQGADALPDYEDPYLVGLLERLDGMDFTEYGLPEDDGEDSYGYGISSDDDYLIQFDVVYDFQQEISQGTPLLLGFGDGLPAVLPLDVQVAFVNPFSAHAREAVAFLEYLAGQMATESEYALCPDLNEVVQRPDADKEIAWYEKGIAETEAELANAEPAERQELEEELESWRREYERYLAEGRWLISQARLDWYRANGERVTVTTPSWFEKDTSGEAWELLERYRGGALSPREFLAAVNQKARMMAMEG